MRRNPDTFITLIGGLKLTAIDDGHYQVECIFEVKRVAGGFKQDPVSNHWVVVLLSGTLVSGLKKKGHSESYIKKVAFCEALRRLKTKLIEGTLQELEPAEEMLSYDDLVRLRIECEPSKIRPSLTFSMNLENEKEHWRLQQKKGRQMGFQQ